MAYNFPEGCSQQFSSTFAAAKTITSMTNASPAVATSVAHGFTTGDEILLTTGWEDATDSIFKITQLTVDTYSINGLDTTDTGSFPAGAGLGTAQKVSAWTVIPQVLTISPSGGDPIFSEVKPLARKSGIKIPTGFNATTVTLGIAHDVNQAAWPNMTSVSRTLTKVGFKQTIKGGGTTYGYGYMAVSEFPKLASGQANQVDVVMALLGRSISY